MVEIQPWSKRVWYVEALIFMLSLSQIGNIVAFLVINIISLVATIIASISLKIKESNVLVQPSLPPDQIQTLDTPGQNYVIVNGVQHLVQSNSLKLDNLIFIFCVKFLDLQYILFITNDWGSKHEEL